VIAWDESSRHEEIWLLLPWLVNGRLSGAEREAAEEHVRHCPECARELEVQHLMRGALTEPDRVTYAPGPSFRKLMERIDQDANSRVNAEPARKAPARARAAANQTWAAKLGSVSSWRPPGVAWAASFLLLFGITGMLATAYRWSAPLYRTHTDNAVAKAPDVLHIALDRSLTIGDVEELLRTSGARIVEGPGNTGIFGVTPVGVTPGQTTETSTKRQLRSLSDRLRSDSRVLWVEPLPLTDDPSPADERAPGTQEH
jgi:hypothetical protein